MKIGVIKWFNDRKGYGFIYNEEYGDIMVHYSAIIGKGYRNLVEGELVRFDVVETINGLKAKNVLGLKRYDVC